MTDDIVERLRRVAGVVVDANDELMEDYMLGREAADEIERLRDALWRIGLPNVRSRIGYCADGHEMAVLTARTALGEK